MFASLLAVSKFNFNLYFPEGSDYALQSYAFFEEFASKRKRSVFVLSLHFADPDPCVLGPGLDHHGRTYVNRAGVLRFATDFRGASSPEERDKVWQRQRELKKVLTAVCSCPCWDRSSSLT